MTFKIICNVNKLLIRARGTAPSDSFRGRNRYPVLSEIAKPTAKLQLIF